MKRIVLSVAMVFVIGAVGLDDVSGFQSDSESHGKEVRAAFQDSLSVRYTDFANGAKFQDFEYSHADRHKLMPFVELFGRVNALASEDGQYMAQTKEELKTYDDLGLAYKYIESGILRSQLNLSQGEGIIIEQAESGGMGYAAGFRAGDLVLTVDDQPVDTQYKLVIALTEKRGKQSRAQIRREGQKGELSFKMSPVVLQDKPRWIMGVSVEEISPELKSHLRVDGAIVTSLTQDGPAIKAGLNSYDVICRLNGHGISNLAELRAAVQKANGAEIKVEFIREGRAMNLTLKPIQVASERNAVPFLADIPMLGTLFTDSPTGVEVQKFDRLSAQLESIQKQIDEIKKTLDK